MRRLKEILGTICGCVFLVQLLISALYVITHPIEFISALFMLVCGIVGFFSIWCSPMHIIEHLTSDKKDENTKREVWKGCAWFLGGVCLLGIVSNVDLNKKSSPTPSYSSTYEREDWLTTMRSYSPPKSDYQPIAERFGKTKTISFSKQPIGISEQPQINITAPPEVIPVRPIRITESSLDLQVKYEVAKELLKDTALVNPPSKESPKELQARVQKDETRRQELKAELEAFHKKWEAEYEANRATWEADLKAEQERLAAELEAQREMLQAEYLNHAQDIFVAGDSRMRLNEIMREVEQDRIRKNQELQRLRNDKMIFGGIR